MKPLPAIANRLAGALLAWALVWGAAVGVAVWTAAVSEVDELLDQTLQASAGLLARLVEARPPVVAAGAHLPAPAAAASETAPVGAANGAANGADNSTQSSTESSTEGVAEGGAVLPEDFAWQLVDSQGQVLARSSLAPAAAWHASPRPGFSDIGAWRLFGQALPGAGHLLYAAQTRHERREARADVAWAAVLAALAVGLLGHIWLRARVRAELRPVQRLSARLAQADASGTPLGPAERRELAPVHEAFDALMARLAVRLANEQAFSAHAAHALRTPLAGIDAQLALALREAPPPLAQRLLRVRDAATRLQGVVAALLGLFRAGQRAERVPVAVADLLARLPTAGLRVQAEGPTPLQADPDLLAAALVNLLDNSLRHGAQAVQITQPAPQTLRLHDDGPGVPEARRAALQHALQLQAYEGHTGLGLMLADRVARAHGGCLQLPAVAQGFAVELVLGPAIAATAAKEAPP